jgi:hypothetical protein
VTAVSSTAEAADEATKQEEDESPQKQTPVKKSSSVGHTRWVESSPTAAASKAEGEGADADAAPATLSLHEEVRRQAEIALREAQAAAAASAKLGVVASKTPIAKAAAVPGDGPSTTTLTGGFISSAVFSGKKSGYVFKRGDLGVGYYIDAKYAVPKEVISVTSTAPPTVNVPAVAAAVAVAPVEHMLFPFECRQTKPALALIVEVPNIDKASLRVEFEPHLVRVTFRAFADVPVEGSGASSIGAIQYGSVLRLRENECPGGLDVSLCRYDAQKKNLAIVLTKAQAKYWHSSAEKRDAAAKVAAGESKSGDVTSDEARSLFQVEPVVSVVTAADGLPPPPPQAATVTPAAESSIANNADTTKALKALESTIQAMQFSSSDALFELD